MEAFYLYHGGQPLRKDSRHLKRNRVSVKHR